MCFLAIGFLLILCMFGLGRSYQNVLYSEDLGEVFLAKAHGQKTTSTVTARTMSLVTR